MNYIEEVRKAYNFKKHVFTFIRHSECIVYQVSDEFSNEKYVLRIQKPNEKLNIYKGNDLLLQLNEEMLLLYKLHNSCNNLYPYPIKNINGKYITMFSDGTYAIVLLWVNGENIKNMRKNSFIMHEVGGAIAKFHIYSRNIDTTLYMNRKIPDEITIAKTIDDIIEKGYIKKDFISIIKSTIQEVSSRLQKIGNTSYGIIHGDLTSTNLIYNGKEIIPIDFGLSCLGNYYFDLGSLMANFYNLKEKKYILQGYEDVCGYKVELDLVEVFLVYYILLCYITQYKLLSERSDYNKIMEEWCYGIFFKFFRKKHIL